MSSQIYKIVVQIHGPFRNVLAFHAMNFKQDMIMLKMTARNFLPGCNAFSIRIPIESLKIGNSNACVFVKSSSRPTLKLSFIKLFSVALSP